VLDKKEIIDLGRGRGRGASFWCCWRASLDLAPGVAVVDCALRGGQGRCSSERESSARADWDRLLPLGRRASSGLCVPPIMNDGEKFTCSPFAARIWKNRQIIIIKT
jgi:hypothetical protein